MGKDHREKEKIEKEAREKARQAKEGKETCQEVNKAKNNACQEASEMKEKDWQEAETNTGAEKEERALLKAGAKEKEFKEVNVVAARSEGLDKEREDKAGSEFEMKQAKEN